MSIFERLQNSIIGGDYQIAEKDIKAGGNLTPRQRIEIYIHGYVKRLMEVVKSDFTATISLLSPEEADCILAAYVHTHPSNYFNLERYAQGFADFLATRSNHPFACEIAKLEQAIAVVFNAPDSEAMSLALLQSLTPETFATMRLHPRTASKMVVFSYPVNQWFMDFREGKTTPIPPPHEQYIYLYRHNNNVMREVLDPASHYLLNGLITGNILEKAIEETLKQHPALQQEMIANWIAKGMFMKG